MKAHNAMKPEPAREQPLRLGILGICLALGLADCIYDENDRCGPDRMFEQGLCVCKDGQVAMGVNCVEKMEAPPPPADGGLGSECGLTDNECIDDTYSECHLTTEDAGYCTTTGCSEDADCGDGFYCSEEEEPAFCKRVPTGQDQPCSAEDDCKNYDANFCSMNPAGRSCVVINCTESSCSPGYVCTDLSLFVAGLPKTCTLPL